MKRVLNIEKVLTGNWAKGDFLAKFEKKKKKGVSTRGVRGGKTSEPKRGERGMGGQNLNLDRKKT